MYKKKIKLFLKVFFLLLLIQFVVIMAEILLNNMESSFSAVTSFIIAIFSMPLSLINANLPFYSGEGVFVTLLFWTLNLVIQTLVIYGGVRMMNRIK